MKTEKIVWGLILVFIGGIFLLKNFDVIDFDWFSVFRFWPLILIIVGVNMLFSRTDFAAGPYVGIALTVGVLAFIGYMGSRPANGPNMYKYNFNFDDDRDERDWKDSKWNTTTLTEPMTASIRETDLSIRGGATSFEISDTTALLVNAVVRSKGSNFTLTSRSRDSAKIVDLNMNTRRRNGIHLKDFDGNKATISLNTRPLWNIDVNVGAGESDFDLSRFRVKSLEFKGGAASFKAKLGIPESITRVSANTGVSEVELLVPAAAGCKIVVHSGLSSRDFEGFNKSSDGSYKTANYDQTEKKIIIELRGGLSDFEVKRYN